MNTPMQLLKNQFDTLKSLLPKEFKETALNKSEDSIYVNHFCGNRTVIEKKVLEVILLSFLKLNLMMKILLALVFHLII